MSKRSTEPEQEPDCYSAALHLIGEIQSYGALLCIDNNTGRIIACSANTSTFLGISAEQLLNRPWHEVLEENAFLTELINPANMVAPLPVQRFWTHRVAGRDCVFSASSDDTQTLVEVEWRSGDLDIDFNNKLGFLRRLAASQTPEQVASLLMEYIARITGFDRVMLYQFLPGWHGKVIAEQNKPGVPGFLGLQFPASDIPPNARQLYLKNMQRFITDTEAETVPLVTREQGQTIDLTWSQLRAVHPVHIEYLHNIDAHSSFSVSIVAGGRLWGMVACHHMTARSMSFELRHLCEELSRIASLHLDGLQTVTTERRRSGLQISLLQMENAMELEQPTQSVGRQLIPAMELLGADSLLLRMGGKFFAHGPLASSGRLGVLRKWLAHHPENRRLWHSSHIPEDLAHDPALVRYTSGMLFIPFGPGRQGNYVLLARNEQVENIRWAGRMPDNPMDRPLPLTPRASFAAWEEQTRRQSLAWDEVELEMAELLGGTLSEDLEKANLEKLANQDSLTGLANRRSFERSLTLGFRAARRNKSGLAVFMLDLDDFKPVNDQYGHDAGDHLLIEVGRRLKHVVRDRDTVARLGGDEFAIIQYHLGGSPLEEIALVAERIVEELSRPVKLEQASVTVGVSVGVALYPEHSRSENQLVKLADEAMYAVKQAGKHSYRIYEGEDSGEQT